MTSRTIGRASLRTGMVVEAPAFIRDEDEKPESLGKIWPGHPKHLRVAVWNDEHGTGNLEALDGDGSIEANTMDFPKTFNVVRDTPARRAARSSEARAGLRSASGRERKPTLERGSANRVPMVMRGRLVR